MPELSACRYAGQEWPFAAPSAPLAPGCRQDVQRKVKGAWKVTRRTIVLDANVLLDKNLTVFL